MLVGGINRGLNGLFKRNKANFGVNEKVLKLRMKSVDNIRKITSAMKMVATAKMRADMDRLAKGKEFGVSVIPTIFANDQHATRKEVDFASKRTLIVPITSDKGLCGAINSQIIRNARDLILADPERYQKIIPIGDKASSGLARQFPNKVVNSLTEVMLPINFNTAAAIGNYVTNYEGDHDSILVIYNEFKNSMSQVIKHVHLMTRERFNSQFGSLVKYEVAEPEPEYAMNYYYELYIGAQFYHSMLQSAACEQASRMNAMENASKNAGDILQDLTLEYNKARQARITMELVEIISGAESL